ncbi:MAG: TRAP transporter permease [Acidaminococcales bacterium]|jgi:TRAP transporter 4TM/12TM fusion protein|nr:TRAP transporter permease [Acidaminococcales bacterium]
MELDEKKNKSGGQKNGEINEEINEEIITIPGESGPLTEEQQAIIEKYDKESSTRTLGRSAAAKLFYWACIAVSLYHFVTSFIGTPVVLQHRSLHVAMMLGLGFIMYPFGRKSSRQKVAWFDWLLIIISFLIPLYVWGDYNGIIERAGRPNTNDLIAATALVLLVLELSRRVTGWTLPLLSVIFIIYGLYGRSLPGMFSHRGYTWLQLSNHFFANTEGIYGTSVSVAASYIFLFILFGAVMGKSGMGSFFNDIAMALAGHTKGGPAKVSVIASGLLGSINGSAVANVVTTGAFTIPLMKRTGYSKEFAGAVEASASVGGQLLPPVMGAAAFIMAENLGVRYSVIIVHAAIPALLYYLGILIQVQLRASKLGLVGLPKSQLPKPLGVLKDKGHLILPLAFLVYMLFFSGTTVLYSAVLAIVATIIISCLKKATRMSGKDVLDAFAEGARATVSVAVACACVGIIIGVSSKTGFGLSMANAIIAMGSQSLLFTLVFSMITCMILGMGLPSIPAYIITATIAAPALAKLGIPAIAAHMFAFYFAMFANLTPPVALASFAAAGLSGGDPMRTGFASVKLAIAGFIVPYMFIYSPQLLLINTSLAEGLRVSLGACIGVLMIGAAVEGYLLTRLNVPLRALSFAGALCLISSEFYTDIVGLLILIGTLLFQYFLSKKQKAAS